MEQLMKKIIYQIQILMRLVQTTIQEFVYDYANNKDSKDFMIHINLEEEDTKNSLLDLSKLICSEIENGNGYQWK